jgi:hypothetical protein
MPVDDAGSRRAQCTAYLVLQRQLKAKPVKHCATRDLLWCIPALRVLRWWQHADGWACLNAANGPLLRAFTESDPGKCFATRSPCQQFRSLRGCGVCRVVHAASSENKWSGEECSLSAAVEPWILVVVLRSTLMVRARCTPSLRGSLAPARPCRLHCCKALEQRSNGYRTRFACDCHGLYPLSHRGFGAGPGHATGPHSTCYQLGSPRDDVLIVLATLR